MPAGDGIQPDSSVERFPRSTALGYTGYTGSTGQVSVLWSTVIHRRARDPSRVVDTSGANCGPPGDRMG